MHETPNHLEVSMSRSIKKIEKAAHAELTAGEEFVSGVFLNPLGFTSKLMMKELGGVVGALLAGPGGDAGGLVSDTGTAARFPDDRVWLGVTNKRVLLWSHGVVAGKPKKLLLELPRADLTEVQLDGQKMVHAVVLRFSDGTGRLYEAPRLMNDAPAFARAANV
jgi:hypothetical protein